MAQGKVTLPAFVLQDTSHSLHIYFRISAKINRNAGSCIAG